MDRLRVQANHQVHGLVVAKNGRLVFEEYFRGGKFISPGNLQQTTFGPDSIHFMASVSKSVTALAVGVAVDRALLDLDTDVLSIFPGLEDLGGGGRDDITLGQLISMRAGLAWDESTYSFSDPRNHLVGMLNSPDPIRYVMGLPLVSTPGTEFHYNSGATNVLGEAVRESTGERMDHLLEEFVFRPLGVQGGWWELVAGDMVFASSGLRLRPRDMAKLGQLMLNQGSWGGVELLSSSWIEESIVPRSSLPWGRTTGYGYGWWLGDFQTNQGVVSSFSARGWGEQHIFVVPELDLVVAITAGMYDGIPVLSAEQIMTDYVMPALQ